MGTQTPHRIGGRIVCILAITVALGGCASAPDPTQAMKKRLEVEKLQRQAASERREAREERLQERIERLPSWVTEKPQADSDGVYGVGVARSTDMSAAMDKASLKADFDIAKQFKQQISGLSKDFTADENGRGSQQFEQVVERFVAAVDMSGQETVEKKVIPVDGKYTAAVLSHLSFDRMEQILARKNDLKGQDRMAKAIEELRNRVKTAQQHSDL